jgi:N,N'-diacetyllegionaminate synthase
MGNWIRIGDRLVGDGEPTYVIAETACSHEGNVEIAYHLIDTAARSKADAVQLQMWSIPHYIVPDHPATPLLKKLQIQSNDWRELIAHAKETGLDVFATIGDRVSADLARECGVDGFKLHSSDLSNPYLTQYLASMRKPITLGTGASTLDEITEGVRMIQRAGCKDIVLMHGYQNYPTTVEEARLRYMQTLKQIFQLPIGYQDHTDGDSPLGFVLPMVAIGMGANVLEKHVTHDRSKKGVDHEAALNPDQLVRFLDWVRQVDLAMGSPSPHEFSEAELRYRRSAKKSIVAARVIAAGETLTEELFLYMRADPGLPPTEARRLVGKQALVDIAKYQNITDDLLG